MPTGAAKAVVGAVAALLVCAAVAALSVLRPRRPLGPAPSGDLNGKEMRTLALELTALQAREKQTEETVWQKEMLAERHGYVLEELWDALNAATNKLALAASVPLRELIPPVLANPRNLGHGIVQYDPNGAGTKWGGREWREFLTDKQREGWELQQLEFRHNQFDLDEANRPKQSRFSFTADLFNGRRQERAVIDGDLTVDWEATTTTSQPAVRSIDASHLTVRTRQGEPVFQLVLDAQVEPHDGSHLIDPLIAYDLDGDGISEIIMAAGNLVFRRGADGHFERERLCRHAPGLIFTAIVGDFDGNGTPDLLCATAEGLVLFRGSAQGRFEEPGQLVWLASPGLKYGQVLSCGDIDGDGDLDVWLGQYKAPYERGQMPTPFYDANDGYPSYLLLNDGRGRFSDSTEASGLAKKRWRRCYSASFADFDGDGDLDLLVVSDFAGMDIYSNDGHGQFTDVTRQWIVEGHGFGMAHAYADFNADGQLDLLMIGMNSPTVDRLEHLGLKRPGFEEFDGMRSRMAYGNRLYLGRRDRPGFEAVQPGDSLVRTGWSWGCSAFDYDNDGFPDVYIANGHVSGRSVREREPEFWLHDIYVGSSRDSAVNYAYLAGKFNQAREQGYSYGGYEKNRLLWNQRGRAFCEVGYLFGVGLESDSRNVVTDDLDGDGRMDLVLTSMEIWPAERQTAQVFRNVLADAGNWIGFRLREEGNGCSPIGARVTLHHVGGTVIRQIVTGESYRSAQANTIHFGLGPIGQVESVEIRWLNGRRRVLKSPAINQYHPVSSSGGP